MHFRCVFSLLLCCVVLGFFQVLQCDELNNFAANIFVKLVIKSRTGIRASIS